MRHTAWSTSMLDNLTVFKGHFLWTAGRFAFHVSASRASQSRACAQARAFYRIFSQCPSVRVKRLVKLVPPTLYLCLVIMDDSYLHVLFFWPTGNITRNFSKPKLKVSWSPLPWILIAETLYLMCQQTTHTTREIPLKKIRMCCRTTLASLIEVLYHRFSWPIRPFPLLL